MISGLKRPRLLVRAARFGVDDYDRSLRLGRLLDVEELPGPGEAIIRLLAAEAAVDERRRANAADYSIAAHVDLLIALMGEARYLRLLRAPSD